jgi:hypothetical protein
VYELRVAWEAPEDDGVLPEASVVRQLISVDGRPPRPKDEPGCMDPKPVTPEPLAMMLPMHRGDYGFSLAGRKKMNGRPAEVIDYRDRTKGAPEVLFDRSCVSVNLPGKARGRVWLDPETHDVLRIEEHLLAAFDFAIPPEHSFNGITQMGLERADSTTQYKPVTFQDPDETLMLPALIETFSVWRGGGSPRVRIRQEFSDYKRFLTDARIVSNVDEK